MQGLVAKKIGMTRVVDAEGQMIPVTLLQVEDQAVTKILSDEKEGYKAVQVGYYVKPERRINKPDLARLKKAGVQETFTRFKEFRLAKQPEGINVGAKLTAELLSGVAFVDVIGITKGRGFEGSTKRWNTAIGRKSHGSRHMRSPGSLGCRTTPGRVFKGKKMPGHWGVEQRTIKNLKVVDVDAAANVIAIRGSVPGMKNGFVFVQPAKQHANKTEKN